MVSEKSPPYFRGQWEMCPLDWWLVEKEPIHIGRQWEKGLITLMVSGESPSYFGGQWERHPLD